MLASYPGSLGTMVCTDSTVCTDAGSAISQMDSVFQGAPANIQAQFQSAHDSIMAWWSANSSWYDSWIPFNPQCCAEQTYGQQAWDLMTTMQQAMGQTPNQGLQAGMGLSTILIVGLVGFIAVSYLLPKR